MKPAAPTPGTPAPTSGGLTRRRKLLLAAEVAGIAAMLVFAGMRPTGDEGIKARLATIAKAITSRFEVGMQSTAFAAAFESVARDFPEAKCAAPHHWGGNADSIIYSDSDPLVRHGLARAIFTRSFAAPPTPPFLAAGRTYFFFVEFEFDTAERPTKIGVWRLQGSMMSGMPTDW